MSESPHPENEVARLRREIDILRTTVRELEARADIDPLTELFNRRGFERELHRALNYLKRYGGTAALIYVDLDNFKPVNDRYGHAAGDAVLRQVAAAMRGGVRASDAVGRLGGDEFAIILWNLDERLARAKAEALERIIAAASTSWENVALTVGASMGTVMLAAEETPVDALIRADRAMYDRKAQKYAHART
jgi:diguanylate cyclase (GGDEF)-like protein